MTGRIRIIGGHWRGRKLEVPADREGLRPTGDRARETLFNWLQMRIHGARCLDLFAGTGALGLEAASRGAGRVVLVERDGDLAAALRRIADQWPGGENVDVVQADALAWIDRASEPFDLIFLDPPFEQSLHQRALDAIAQSGIVAPGGLVYVERGIDEPEIDPDADYTVLRQKRQGRVVLSLLGFGSDVAL